MRRTLITVFSLSLFPFLLTACVKDAPSSSGEQSTGTLTPQPPDDPQAPLRQHVTDLTRITNLLPGDSDTYPELMSNAFNQMAQILPLLQPQGTNGAFRQRIRILETTRDRLNSNTDGIIAPAINSGLRAMHSALRDIAAARFPNDQPLDLMLQSLDMQLRDLDTTRRSIHPFAASRAVNQVRDIVARMLQTLSTPAPTPTTNPAE